MVYELMMLLLVLLVFLKKDDRLLRSFSAFVLIVIGGDLADKLMGVYTYVYSDIVLVFLAVITSVILYGRNGKLDGKSKAPVR